MTRLEEILEKVLMGHHQDISQSDDNAIGEAKEQILALFKECLGEDKPFEDFEQNSRRDTKRGWNARGQQAVRRMEEV